MWKKQTKKDKARRHASMNKSLSGEMEIQQRNENLKQNQMESQ